VLKLLLESVIKFHYDDKTIDVMHMFNLESWKHDKFKFDKKKSDRNAIEFNQLYKDK